MKEFTIRNNEISLYNGKLTAETVKSIKKSLTIAFPELSESFFDMFFDRIKANNFSDARLKDAVNHVIDTCVYPKPAIANFILFDKKIKLVKHQQIVELNQRSTENEFANYAALELPGADKVVWALLSDVEGTKLEKYIKNKK